MHPGKQQNADQPAPQNAHTHTLASWLTERHEENDESVEESVAEMVQNYRTFMETLFTSDSSCILEAAAWGMFFLLLLFTPTQRPLDWP